MKHKLQTYIGLFALLLLTFTSCQEDYNERYLLVDNYIEFEEAVSATVAVGKNFPIINKTVAASYDAFRLQINMTGEQLTSDQNLAWRVVEEESTAVAGRDYEIENGGVLVLPASSSQAFLGVKPLNGGQNGSVLVLELVGNDFVEPMENYKRLGLRFVFP